MTAALQNFDPEQANLVVDFVAAVEVQQFWPLSARSRCSE